jgi:hypothetical protein
MWTPVTNTAIANAAVMAAMISVWARCWAPEQPRHGATSTTGGGAVRASEIREHDLLEAEVVDAPLRIQEGAPHFTTMLTSRGVRVVLTT